MRNKNYYKINREQNSVKINQKRNFDPVFRLNDNLGQLVFRSCKMSKDDKLWNYVGSAPKFLTKWFAYFGSDYLTRRYEIDHIKPDHLLISKIQWIDIFVIIGKIYD